jgi:hypothetical protein
MNPLRVATDDPEGVVLTVGETLGVDKGVETGDLDAIGVLEALTEGVGLVVPDVDAFADNVPTGDLVAVNDPIADVLDDGVADGEGDEDADVLGDDDDEPVTLTDALVDEERMTKTWMESLTSWLTSKATMNYSLKE